LKPFEFGVQAALAAASSKSPLSASRRAGLLVNSRPKEIKLRKLGRKPEAWRRDLWLRSLDRKDWLTSTETSQTVATSFGKASGKGRRG
jgi:hypothetical protein